MAAFKVLLWRYTRQDDLVVGFPVGDRGRPALENLIGSFVNTLALRSDLSGDPTFTQLLARLRANLQEALAHRELPFERLVDELKQARDSNRTPIFQTLFTFQNRLPAELNLPGIRSEADRLRQRRRQIRSQLSLGRRPTAGSAAFLNIAVHYSPTTPSRAWCRHFSRAVKSDRRRPEPADRASADDE